MTTQTTTQHDTTNGRTSTRSGSGRTASRSSTSRRSGTRDGSGSADSSSPRERSGSRAAGSTDGRRRQTAAGRGPGTAPDEGNGVTARGSRAAGRNVAPSGTPKAAAEHANRRNSVKLRIPLVGTMNLPATDELAFLGGVGVLAVAGIIEWPVAVVLGAGHALVAKHRGKVLREFGEALEEA